MSLPSLQSRARALLPVTPVHSSFPHPGANLQLLSHIFASQGFLPPRRNDTVSGAQFGGRSQTQHCSVKLTSEEMRKLGKSPRRSRRITDCWMVMEEEGGEGEGEGAVTLPGALSEKAFWNYQSVHKGITNPCDLPVPAVHTPKYNGAQHES